ncbi:MAG: hypothetical protein KC478_16180 [Bacteriovoracaceae bacterium]|nr:hypothetical protein [Bacteriovoracaceae bacterium]
MLKFNDSVYHSENDVGDLVIVSFDHDDLIFITGPLKKIIQKFDQGITLDQLEKSLSSHKVNSQSIEKLIGVFQSRNMFSDKDYTSKKVEENLIDFGELGEVRIKVFEYDELEVYAAMMES